MSNIDGIRKEREKKMEMLEAAGMPAYPVHVKRDETVAGFLHRFTELETEGREITIAGRIMTIRGHGAILFCDLYDGTARSQVIIQKDILDEKSFQLFADAIDSGDFVSVTGSAFTTKRGEKSLQAKNWVLAAKSLLPLPDEWFGIKDEELRYRERYVDLLLSSDLHELFIRKSKFWNTIRTFLLDRDFIEVETPVLETDPGGADARPFVTHHNALDMDVHLRISAGELWQKRLLVAGYPKVFEIGRIFRNEGMSNEHLQDYTQLEFYQAFSNYSEGMTLVKDLYRKIAEDVYGKVVFPIREFNVDLAGEWYTVNFCETIKERFSIDPLTCSDEDAMAAAKKAGIEVEKGANKTRAIDLLWKQVRKTITGPAFLIGIPAYLEPLAKRSTANPEIVERFQVIIAGSEVGKGFSELNDPRDQFGRFMEQQKLRDGGDEEAQRLDLDYVHALEYGMPPAFGFGVSERLFAFFENKPVRESQLFPLLRPKKD